MSASPSTVEIIASALALPAADRRAVIDALHGSLADPSIDHGPKEEAPEVANAWSEEIARRVSEVISGDAKTVPAELAERMIRGDG